MPLIQQLKKLSMLSTLRTINQEGYKLQNLFTNVNKIYCHPNHYTYLIHKTDNYLHVFDVATMQFVGKSRYQIDDVNIFAFSNNFNVFYGLKSTNGKLLLFQMNHVGFILTTQMIYQPCLFPLQRLALSKQLLFSPNSQILVCISDSLILLLHLKTMQMKSMPQLNYNNKTIKSSLIVEMSSLLWVVYDDEALYLVRFYDFSYQKFQLSHKIFIGSQAIIQRENDKNEWVTVITKTNEIILIKIVQVSMIVCWRYNPIQTFKARYATVMRLGVDTSTTDKFKNTIYAIVYGHQIKFEQENKMIEQSKQEQKAQKILIITLQPSAVYPLMENKHPFIILSSLPYLMSGPFSCPMHENKLFLPVRENLFFINLSLIKGLQIHSQEWSCMGYRFEVLDQNEVYLQKQNQFEDDQNITHNQVSKDMLDDWSHSLLTKQLAIKKSYSRIKTFDA